MLSYLSLKFQHSDYSIYFVSIKMHCLLRVIETTRDISSEMNSMEAEPEQNKSVCLESCCRLELMKRQNVPN